MEKEKWTWWLAIAFTIAVPAIGYISLGIIPALIFLCGYAAGFIFWHFSTNTAWSKSISVVYWLTFGLFIVHRIEEKYMGFFDALSDLTAMPKPEITSTPIIALVLLSVGGWIAAPFMIERKSSFGYYLAWTFLASAGISELAHFIFPFFKTGNYGYFPGMWSVFALAPVAWYGMVKLKKSNTKS